MIVNVSNMEINTVYRFGENYIWSIIRDTASNGEQLPKPTKLTEVYRIDSMGLMKKIASGILHVDPNDNNRFTIYDYAQKRELAFTSDDSLKKVNLNDLYRMQSAIEERYEKKRR